MQPLVFSFIAGVSFGLFSVLVMLPMTFPDKRTALSAAFLSRFAIGFLIPLVTMPVPPIAKGIAVAVLISLPDAVVTKAYVPILTMGAVGGAIIGWAAAHFVA